MNLEPTDSLSYRLLAQLRDAGPASRAELADQFGVPRSRMLAELETLTQAGLIQEAGLAASRGGRRSTLVTLAPDIRFAAVDLGATSIDVEIVDGRLEPIAARSEAVDIRSGPKAVLHTVTDVLSKFKAEGVYERLRAIGIGVPGPVSFRDGVPVSPPIMPGWDRYPVRDLLAREHGCPVVVDNDVNIMAVGECYGGVARSVDNLLFVKIGTGIGCGIQLGGQVYRGTDGCAGDIGHIQVEDRGPQCSCGNVGCLEALFGGAALARDALAAARAGASEHLAARLAAGGELSAVDVAMGATAGDPVCMKLIRDGGRRVGTVLAGLVSFINPSMIVIGGGLATLGHTLLAEIRSVVYRRSLPLATGNLPIVLSELGPRAGVVGAALLASTVAYGDQEW
jgi:glucokinase-like ROK family protein